MSGAQREATKANGLFSLHDSQVENVYFKYLEDWAYFSLQIVALLIFLPLFILLKEKLSEDRFIFSQK